MRTKKKSAAITYLEKLNGGPFTFAQMIESFRLCEEMSQTSFAKMLGISRAHLCDIEKGRRFVSVERAVHFAKALGWPPHTFIRLALQDQVSRAGLRYSVDLHKAA